MAVCREGCEGQKGKPMGTFEFIIAIVAIVFGTGLIKTFLASRKNAVDTDSLSEELGLNDKLSRIDRLEDRVRTLERIVTDKSERLSEDIEKL